MTQPRLPDSWSHAPAVALGKDAQFQGLVEVRPATLGYRVEASGLTWRVKSAAS